MNLALPFLALISRSPQRINNKLVDTSKIPEKIHENMQWTSLHEHFAVQLGVSYHLNITEYLIQTFSYEFQYIYNHMSNSRLIQMGHNRLTLSLGYKF
jgi:hypothetical protein